jgi:hypothetical protein
MRPRILDSRSLAGGPCAESLPATFVAVGSLETCNACFIVEDSGWLDPDPGSAVDNGTVAGFGSFLSGWSVVVSAGSLFLAVDWDLSSDEFILDFESSFGLWDDAWVVLVVGDVVDLEIIAGSPESASSETLGLLASSGSSFFASGAAVLVGASKTARWSRDLRRETGAMAAAAGSFSGLLRLFLVDDMVVTVFELSVYFHVFDPCKERQQKLRKCFMGSFGSLEIPVAIVVLLLLGESQSGCRSSRRQPNGEEEMARVFWKFRANSPSSSIVFAIQRVLAWASGYADGLSWLRIKIAKYISALDTF